MNRDPAIFLAYVCAEALNQEAFLHDIALRLYGTHGVGEALKGIEALSQEYGFSVPAFSTALLQAVKHE